MAKNKTVQDVLHSQKKLKTLQQEIVALQEKEKELQQEIAANMSTLLSDMGALSIPQEVLIGGILHIIDSYHQNSTEIGGWLQAGQTFLDQKKGNKSKAKKNKPSHQEAA